MKKHFYGKTEPLLNQKIVCKKMNHKTRHNTKPKITEP
jgi:hypothetical protein